MISCCWWCGGGPLLSANITCTCSFLRWETKLKLRKKNQHCFNFLLFDFFSASTQHLVGRFHFQVGHMWAAQKLNSDWLFRFSVVVPYEKFWLWFTVFSDTVWRHLADAALPSKDTFLLCDYVTQTQYFSSQAKIVAVCQFEKPMCCVLVSKKLLTHKSILPAGLHGSYYIVSPLHESRHPPPTQPLVLFECRANVYEYGLLLQSCDQGVMKDSL